MFHFGTNHHANGGTASCRSAVFFGLEEEGKRTKRMGEDLESKKTGIGEDGSGTRRRMGEDFERRKEDGEDGKWTRRKKKRNFERTKTGL